MHPSVQAASPQTVFSFMQATQGSWRNSIYVTDNNDGDFLCSISLDGAPVSMLVTELAQISNESIEKEECLCSLNKEGFDTLFHRWLLWNSTATQKGCRASKSPEYGTK